jgi:hypothetical protein
VRNIIAMTFPSEPAAYQGLRALEQLHADGTITLYESVVIERHATGHVESKHYRRAVRPRRRTDIRALVGVLDANVPPTAFGLIADVHEAEPGSTDARIADLGGTIVRRARPFFDDSRVILTRSADDARDALEQTKLELHDKVRVLQEQLVNARPDVRTVIEQRIVDIRRELGQRERKLSRVVQTLTRAITPRPR